MLKKLLDYLYFTIFIVLTLFILGLPNFLELNYLVLDRLQGSDISARKEIVIIGIDDQSLSKIGAWPWDRDVYAQAFDNLNDKKPRVVGLDVLFLESRKGDAQLQNSLNNSDYNLVFGAKTYNDKVLESKFNSDKTSNGLIDFLPDNDAKIRRINLARNVDNKCENSFSLQLYIKYLGIKNPETCKETISLRSNNIPNNYEFVYTKENFRQYSFLDLYENKIPKQELQDKIVLIGSTALDLKSNLSDNFQDVFGQQIPGIKIHANLLNSLLENKYQKNLSYSHFIFLGTIFSLFTFLIYRLLKRNLLELLFFIGLLILNNFGGLFIYGYNYNWFFFQSNFILIAGYVFYIAYKYFILERESRITEKAFSKYVNPEILRQIKQNPEQLKLGGERKEVTVFFSDIRGFTTFSEKLQPEELVTLINDYLSAMTDIILESGGTVDKYIGDAIMAFWNAPVNQEEHALLALSTSLKMHEALAKFNKQYGWEMKIGMSLNTGDVIVGNVGSQERFNYTILGDNVNLGSRLESLTKKYGVVQIVSESVIEKLESTIQNLKQNPSEKNTKLLAEADKLIYRFLDEAKVKGKNKPIKIYEPLENTPGNQEIVKNYNLAFSLYQKGEFEKAKQIWSKISNDEPSKIMLERISKITDSEKQNWDGVWRWTEK